MTPRNAPRSSPGCRSSSTPARPGRARCSRTCRVEYTVRDMDRIRAALGDDKLTYLGFSYGTYLGTLYAAAFPDKVRALVLDGAVDPSISASDQQVQQAVGFEQSLDQFLKFCSGDSGCAFHRDGKSAAAYDTLRARVDAHPLAGADRTGAASSARPSSTSPSPRRSTPAGRSGRRSPRRSTTPTGATAPTCSGSRTATPDGRSDGQYDAIDDAFFAIGCPDGPPMGGLVGMREIEDRAQAAAPRLGRSIVNNSLACAIWPVQPTADRGPGARAGHAADPRRRDPPRPGDAAALGQGPRAPARLRRAPRPRPGRATPRSRRATRASTPTSSATSSTSRRRRTRPPASPAVPPPEPDGPSDPAPTLPGRWTFATPTPTRRSAPSSREWLDRSLPELPPPPRRDDWPARAAGTPTGSAGCSTPATRACTGRRSTAAAARRRPSS